MNRHRSISLRTILILLLFGGISQAAFEQQEVGARAVGMSGAYVALSEGAEGPFWNPAGISRLRRGAWFSSYTRLFDMEELTLGTFGAAFPSSVGSFGAGLQVYGFSLYRETTLCLSWARQVLGENSAGAVLRSLTVKVQGRDPQNAFALDLGWIGRVYPTLQFGIAVQNVTGAQIGKGEKLPRTFNLGLAFKPVGRTLLSIDLRKESHFPFQLRVGGEHRMSRRFLLRAGAGGNPSRFALGTGFRVGRLSIDYAFHTHLVLGLTHQVSLSGSFGSRNRSRR